jgi:cytochrome c peroxidase
MFSYILCLALGDGSVSTAPVFTDNEWAILKTMSPAIVVSDTTNAYEQHADAAKIGQTIFFDKRFSSNKEVSCATCHEPSKYFTDAKQVSTGTGKTTRNSPTVLNAAHQRWFFWDGRADTLWGQPIQTMEHPDEMNISRLEIANIIVEDETLGPLWIDTFGKMQASDIDTVAANVAKSVAAYITKLDSSHAPFDDFVAGDSNAISHSAQRGLKYFITDGGCLRCHFGPWITDGAFHSIGIAPLDGGPLRDSGRAGAIDMLNSAKFAAGGKHSDDTESARAIISKHIAKRREDWGAFRTPSLRNVAKTPPYMHAGQLATLEDVLNHYSTLEQFVSADHHRETILEPLHLTDQQTKDLIAFLESLTSPLPEDSLLKAPE